MDYSDVIMFFYLWSYRLAIIALAFLTVKQLRISRTLSSWIILSGLLSIIAASFGEIIAFQLYVRNILGYRTYGIFQQSALVISGVGYIICVYGLYRKNRAINRVSDH
ncbi:MAG: hypothetical protein C4550_03245 [Nitrospiraceae bacterium]|nr:MAG: hypothetical protein C4550_03245 [Nitrospiraceae bacterium]